MDTRLIFVRHGQSLANTDNFFAGHVDVPLTSLGREQARLMADFLKDYPIAAVYASDLCRCTETARPIAALLGLPVFTDARLREIHAGAWQKKDFLFLNANEDYKIWRTGKTSFRPHGGENMQQLFDRTRAAIEDIVKKHAGETVAVITHATPIRVLKTAWVGVPLSSLTAISSPPNASITIVNYKKDGTQAILLDGENRFLGELADAPTTQM